MTYSVPISAQVRKCIEFARANIGEDAAITLQWDRTGASTLPLIGGRDQWTAENLFGRMGQFTASAENSKLPIQDAQCGYRLIGGDLELTPKVVIRNFASPSGAVGSDGGAVGFGPLTILTVFQLISGIWQILHPTVAVALPGNMELTMSLAGDAVTVDFVRMPSVHAKAFFTVDLDLKQVVIDPENARLSFKPSANGGFFSRFIESRDVRLT